MEPREQQEFAKRDRESRYDANSTATDAVRYYALQFDANTNSDFNINVDANVNATNTTAKANSNATSNVIANAIGMRITSYDWKERRNREK